MAHSNIPTLTLEDAAALQSSFKGHITSSHDAQVEFPGTLRVLIPESIADVERALCLAQAAHRRVFVRSGCSISTVDVHSSAAAVSGAEPAAAILSVEAFRYIDISDHQITVGAAATTAAVAQALVDKNLFLPLDDNPTQSIVSAVLSMDTSPFFRSGAGPLRSAVVEAEVVPIEGDGASIAKTLRDAELHALLTGTRSAIITKLVFDAAAAKTDKSDRWTQAWMAPYEQKAFATLCDDLFGTSGGSVPEGVDLSVRATSAAYAVTLIVVRATGHGDANCKVAEAIAKAALDRAKLPVLDAALVTGPGSSVAAWVSMGPNDAVEDEVLTRFGSNTSPRPFTDFRQDFFEAVDFAIGVSDSTGQEHAPGIRAWVDLQLAQDGGVVARAQISDARADPSITQEARRRMAAAILDDEASTKAAGAPPAVVRRAATRTAMRGVEVLPQFIAPSDFDLVSSNRAGSNKIPGFKGEVFSESDGYSYRKAIDQYAVSSYSSVVVAARMTPRLVAKPVDAKDVELAVTFAATNQLKVVARSGGHQYCGLSSGGNDTLLLDMTRFTKVVFSPSTGTPTQVTVGPGVALRDVSKKLLDKGVAIPHGECPLVRLGGHVQTGGIGHQLRSLGATLDWVRSFKLVTRAPESRDDVYVEREFTWPGAEGGVDVPTDGDVFRAVLGGGPSSWGVLTEITFDLLPDFKYPESAGYSYTYPYEIERFSVAMDHIREWTERQAKGELPPGMDLFLTVVSGDLFRLRPAALLVETMCRDAAGLGEIKKVVDSIPPSLFTRRAVNGSTKLSVVADAGVREIGVFGLPRSGREFDLPYKKSLHITKTPLSADFCRQFVDLVDSVHKHAGVKVVFQAVVGGGEFSANGANKTTHMQRRDALLQLVFDVFYERGHETDAERFQLRIKNLLRNFSNGEDIRMLWGTFEDANTQGRQLDMNMKAVQALYYDSRAEYERLQRIKEYTDPRDIFHTSFTVQLPG